MKLTLIMTLSTPFTGFTETLIKRMKNLREWYQ